MVSVENVLVKPLLTEKTSKTTEQTNRYGFIVNKASNKNQVKAAVEKFFDVKVLAVATVNLPGKLKKSGKGMKKTQGFKKAYVKIQAGQKIEFFKGI